MSTPRERRHDITRQKILDTARRIIVNQGVESFSIRTLAKEIDYSPSAVYKYFDSKEKILQAIREEGWQLAAAFDAETHAAAVPLPQKLLAAGRMYLKFAETYPEHYLLMFNTPADPPPEVAALDTDAHFTGLAKLIEEGIASGDFKLPPGYTPLLLAFQMWTSAHGMAMLKLTVMRDSGETFSRFCEEVLERFIALIIAQ